jgi:iron(III) transport system substrate-binding protein
MNKRVLALLVLVTVAVIAGIIWTGSRHGQNTVVIYVSEDQVFSEPILKDFERDTGTRVQAVYDTEESKSAGVMNRLVAEQSNPQADVYWANEPIRAEALRQRGVAAAYRSPSAQGIPEEFRDPHGYWTGFSARARMLIVSSGDGDKPTSIQAYLDPRFRGKGIIANPLFGTTTAHIAALFTVWGDERGKRFLDGLRANQVHIAASNGDSADRVAAGTVQFGLVDSDDVFSRRKRSQAIDGIYPDQGDQGLGCFIVPNAVLLISDGPHPEGGKKLIDYLLSPATERKLAESDAAQIPLHPGVPMPTEMRPLESLKVMRVDYAQVAAKMQAIQPLLKDWAER